jgi:hypothetical protein
MLWWLVTSGLLCSNSWLRGPVAQRLEQGIHNSRKSFCGLFSQRCAPSLLQTIARPIAQCARLGNFVTTNVHYLGGPLIQCGRRALDRIEADSTEGETHIPGTTMLGWRTTCRPRPMGRCLRRIESNRLNSSKEEHRCPRQMRRSRFRNLNQYRRLHWQSRVRRR